VGYRLVYEFNALTEQGKGVVVRYEDLKKPKTRQDLIGYLEVDLVDANTLSRIVKPGLIDNEPSQKKILSKT
jgi:hypothetical protein